MRVFYEEEKFFMSVTYDHKIIKPTQSNMQTRVQMSIFSKMILVCYMKILNCFFNIIGVPFLGTLTMNKANSFDYKEHTFLSLKITLNIENTWSKLTKCRKKYD